MIRPDDPAVKVLAKSGEAAEAPTSSLSPEPRPSEDRLSGLDAGDEPLRPSEPPVDGLGNAGQGGLAPGSAYPDVSELFQLDCRGNLLIMHEFWRKAAWEAPPPVYPPPDPETMDADYRRYPSFGRLGLMPGYAQGAFEGAVFQKLWEEGPSPDQIVDSLGIRAAGRRPEDFRRHDLLCGSLLRNRRVPSLKRLAVRPEDWQLAATSHLPADQRKRACQVLALYRAHLRGLERITKDLPEELEGPDAYRFLNQIVGCTPTGLMFDEIGVGRAAFYCRRTRVCPWCLARRADGLYTRLVRVLGRSHGQGGKLVLGRIRCCVINQDTPVDRHEVKRIRAGVGDALCEWAGLHGATGGLLIHQVGPIGLFDQESRMGDDYRDREHDVAILFEMPDVARMGSSKGIDAEVIGLPLELAWAPRESPQSLRYLLYGFGGGA